MSVAVALSARDQAAQLRASVTRLSAAGVSPRAIASRLGVTERTVFRHRRAAGLTVLRGRPHNKAHFPDEVRAAAKRLLDDGASYSEVETTFDIAHGLLKKVFPGYEWTLAQHAAHTRAVRRLDALPNHLTRPATYGLSGARKGSAS